MEYQASGIVLETFTPSAISDWTDIYVDYVGLGDYYSLTDTFDFTTGNTATNTPPAFWLYKEAVQTGCVHRIKCSFSIDSLPKALTKEQLISLGFLNTLDPDPYNWIEYIRLFLKDDGALSFSSTYGSYNSTNKISVNTTYQLEIWCYFEFVDYSINHSRFCILINGNIWFDSGTWLGPAMNQSYTYVRLSAGFMSTWTNGPIEVNMHIGNIVWTMENVMSIGSGRWTMMAIL